MPSKRMRARQSRLDQPHDDAGERRLAAAGRTDQRQRLAARAARSETPSSAAMVRPPRRNDFDRPPTLEQRRAHARARVGIRRACGSCSSDARVVGSRGASTISCGGADLDQPAMAQHRDAVGDAGGQRDVVADEEQRHAVCLRPARSISADDLGLDDGVERAGRLVGDQQFRPGGDRRGDARRAASGRRKAGADRPARMRSGSGRRTRSISSTAMRRGPAADRGRDGCARPRRSGRRPRMTGSRLAPGSWKTKPMSRAADRRVAEARPVDAARESRLARQQAGDAPAPACSCPSRFRRSPPAARRRRDRGSTPSQRRDVALSPR